MQEGRSSMAHGQFWMSGVVAKQLAVLCHIVVSGAGVFSWSVGLGV